jgi:hypothetical protein
MTPIKKKEKAQHNSKGDLVRWGKRMQMSN